MSKNQFNKFFNTKITGIFWITLLVALLNATNLIAVREITNAVDRQLILHSATPTQMIDVETHDGIVTLSGTVNNLPDKDRVVKVPKWSRASGEL